MASLSSTPAELGQRTLKRRAVEAAIWGMPLVSVDAMRRAFQRDAKANYGDILFLSKPADWKFQMTTPNASSLYVYFNVNTSSGAVVIEVPPAVDAGLFGSIVEAWEVPLVDIGPEGEDKGEGGKYLLMPPSYPVEKVPLGYIPLFSETFNGYALFRVIPRTSSAEDHAKALAVVKALRVYPLSQGSKRTLQRHIDISGTLLDGIVRFDDTFYDGLARMVNEEPVHERDMVAMAQLRSIGIEKGKAFAPDAATRDALREAISEAHAGFMSAVTVGERWWADAHWILSASVGPRTRFTYQTEDHLEIDERGTLFFLAFAAPKNLGAATFYCGAFVDAGGNALLGENNYRLHVPPDVPVNQYWAVTAYALDTAGFIIESPRLSVDSYASDTLKNADGSLDVYFGATPAAGKETNWICTTPGKRWFAFFRFYGPQKAVLDRSWRLGDIQPV